MTKNLFPPLNTFETGMLPVDDIHTLYWEQSGNPQGVPVVFVHGGPGGGTSPKGRQFFDPDFYRIIQFDQRGSGRSTPMGELTNNTTPHLIQDMETLRTHLGIDKWVVFGGSWGSTLGIAYAQVHPDQCLGLILRGIFLCREEEIRWFYQEAGVLYPEPFRKLSEFVPPAERHDLVAAYYKRLTGTDPEIAHKAAHLWSWYEGMCSTLLPNEAVLNSFTTDATAIPIARIETHYFMNKSFLPEEGLLAHVDKIRHIPTFIVQGRYDIPCPIRTADELARAMPEATYVIVPDAGHSAYDPSLCEALVQATQDMKQRLKR